MLLPCIETCFGPIRPNVLIIKLVVDLLLWRLQLMILVPVRTTSSSNVWYIYCELNTNSRTTATSEEGTGRTFWDCHTARSDDCWSWFGKRVVLWQQAAPVFVYKTRLVWLFFVWCNHIPIHCCTAVVQGSCCESSQPYIEVLCCTIQALVTVSLNYFEVRPWEYWLCVLVQYCSHCECSQYFGALYCRYYSYSEY